jgi:hypothetical protein
VVQGATLHKTTEQIHKAASVLILVMRLPIGQLVGTLLGLVVQQLPVTLLVFCYDVALGDVVPSCVAQSSFGLDCQWSIHLQLPVPRWASRCSRLRMATAVGQNLVKCWSNIGQMSVKCWSNVGQLLEVGGSLMATSLWSNIGQSLAC